MREWLPTSQPRPLIMICISIKWDGRDYTRKSAQGRSPDGTQGLYAYLHLTPLVYWMGGDSCSTSIFHEQRTQFQGRHRAGPIGSEQRYCKALSGKSPSIVFTRITGHLLGCRISYERIKTCLCAPWWRFSVCCEAEYASRCQECSLDHP